MPGALWRSVVFDTICFVDTVIIVAAWSNPARPAGGRGP
jgi:hypothetical protein